MLPLSFVILTFNEERDLPRCLESLRDVSDDVAVLDSGSTDNTVAIAESYGCRVYNHAFTGFGDQRNWAIDNIPGRYEWTFHLDADERITPALCQEIGTVLEQTQSEAGFYIANKLMLGKHWLRYSSGYPVYQVRLFHRDRLRFENYGHGQREITQGRLGKLREPYLHFAFSKGLDHWLEKHIQYSHKEADQASCSRHSVWKELGGLASSPSERRRSLKQISHRLPFRPTMRLLYTLLWQRGVLDGRAGITYARLLALYESMTKLHTVWKKLQIDEDQADETSVQGR